MCFPAALKSQNCPKTCLLRNPLLQTKTFQYQVATSSLKRRLFRSRIIEKIFFALICSVQDLNRKTSNISRKDLKHALEQTKFLKRQAEIEMTLFKRGSNYQLISKKPSSQIQQSRNVFKSLKSVLNARATLKQPQYFTSGMYNFNVFEIVKLDWESLFEIFLKRNIIV